MRQGRLLKRLYRHGVQLMAVGVCTGIFAGIIVTFYNLAAEFLGKYSQDIYTGIRENPEFVPLLFVVLAISAFAIGTLVYLIPAIRGSGIPQTEGATRGLVKFKWYQTLPAMAAASLYCIFCGLTAGAEGPSLMIGASCGDGTGRLFHCNDMERRYQITGGASAGLAVAFNAPLTGIIFAFEEAHRRFTPAIFICAFTSVLSGIITRSVLYDLMGLEVTEVLTSFVLVQMPLKSYGFVAIAAVVCGLCGVGFYYLCMLMRKVFAKITFFKGIGKMLIPFLTAGVFGLITLYVMGGGASFINALGTEGGKVTTTLETIFNSPIAVTLVIVLIMRVISTSFNLGAGVPAGVFIPMLAIGACLGALISRFCILIGMDTVFSDCIVMISMATFFASVVKSPLTAIVMVVELTWQFSLLIPVILGVAVGYLISEIFGTKPLYEKLLESILDEQHIHPIKYTYSTTIDNGAMVAGSAIRDVLWPGNMLIRSVHRDGNLIVPSSDTVLRVGDEITLQAECVDFEDLKNCIDELVKPRKHLLSNNDRNDHTNQPPPNID